MTRRRQRLREVEKIVLTFDICSSSTIIEDLSESGNITKWRDLLIGLKEYIFEEADAYEFNPYKFVGDGWILLFEPDTEPDQVFGFAEELSVWFEKKIIKMDKDYLQSTPDIMGLTFGIDKGKLVRFIMDGQAEYVGRPINISCRLQSAIQQSDNKPQYKVLMPKYLFSTMKKDIDFYKHRPAKRQLHNITRGKDFKCELVFL